MSTINKASLAQPQISLSSGDSLLDIVAKVDNGVLPVGPWSSAKHSEHKAAARSGNAEHFIPFFLLRQHALAKPQRPIGFLRPSVVSALVQDNKEREAANSAPCWDLQHGEDPSDVWAISFADWFTAKSDNKGDAVKLRTEQMDRLARKWRAAGAFNDTLGGWREELYAVYGPEPENGPGDHVSL